MSSSATLKDIHYRGILVVFKLPQHWSEEYEPDGGGCFYDPADESITLRLNVLTLTAPKGQAFSDASLVLEAPKSMEGGTITSLANGQAMLVPPVQNAVESNEPLQLFRWMVARAIPSSHARIAIFTATVVPRLADPEKLKATLTILSREIAECTIADQPVQSPPRRSWWKRLLGQ